MYSSLIGKIEKAKRYAQEGNRVTLTSFKANFRGDHNSYLVRYDIGTWSCGCGFFTSYGTCSHTMALQRMLEGLLPAEVEVEA